MLVFYLEFLFCNLNVKEKRNIPVLFSFGFFYLCTSWRQNSETTPTRPWQNVKNPSDVLSSLQAPTSWSHSDTARQQVARICLSLTQKNTFSSILVNYFGSENYGQFLKWPQGDSTTKRTESETEIIMWTIILHCRFIQSVSILTQLFWR